MQFYAVIKVCRKEMWLLLNEYEIEEYLVRGIKSLYDRCREYDMWDGWIHGG